MGKTRLPPQLAWPVGDEELKTALGENWGRVRVVRMIRGNNGSGNPLTVSWSPDDDDGGELSVWIFAVSRDDLLEIRGALATGALPALDGWVRKALLAGPAWGMSRHEKRWHWTDRGLRTEEDDGMHILTRERGTHGRGNWPKTPRLT